MSAEWMTAPNLRRARQLWDAGLPTSEIARRIGHGCTKSCIVGAAHRRAWPARPSPIGRRKGEPVEAAPRVGPKPHRRAGELTRMPPGEAKAKHKPREIVERVACRPQVLAVPTPRFAGCQFIAGDDRHTWTKCDAATVPGRPYCLAHCTVCYLKPGQKAWMLEAA